LSGGILPHAFPLQETHSNLQNENTSFPWYPFYPDDDDDEDSLVGTEGNPNYPPLASNLSLQEDSDVSDDSVHDSEQFVDNFLRRTALYELRALSIDREAIA
jgi:hypothetical protein